MYRQGDPPKGESIIQDEKAISNVNLKQLVSISSGSQDTSNENLGVNSFGCRGLLRLGILEVNQPGRRQWSVRIGKRKGGKVWQHMDEDKRRSSFYRASELRRC